MISKGDQLQEVEDINSLENTGNKVLYCTECQTAVFSQVQEIINERGKVIKLCQYCGDALGMRSADRAGSFTEGKVLGDTDSIRTYAIRSFTSPYGRLRLYLSTNSYFAPFVELDGVKSPAIKRLIDEEFSNESIINVLNVLPQCDDVTFSVFVVRLQDIIKEAHTNPHTAIEVDFDAVAA